MSKLDEYLPIPPNNHDYKKLRDYGGISLREAKSKLMIKYRHDMKAGLRAALSDYVDAPSEMGGEVFLAEILRELKRLQVELIL